MFFKHKIHRDVKNAAKLQIESEIFKLQYASMNDITTRRIFINKQHKDLQLQVCKDDELSDIDRHIQSATNDIHTIGNHNTAIIETSCRFYPARRYFHSLHRELYTRKADAR